MERFPILPLFPRAELRVSVSHRTASVILCPTVPSCVHLFNIYLSISDSISFGRALTEEQRLLFKEGHGQRVASIRSMLILSLVYFTKIN